MSELWFDGEWLSLRRRADHQARDTLLNEEANYALLNRGRANLVDLGAGHGNNAQYLLPWLGLSQHWRLVDHDAKLLAQAERTLTPLLDDTHSLQTLIADLNNVDLPSWHQQWPIDLVTASALLDLGSHGWLMALVEQVVSIEACALWVLNVNGHWKIDGSKHPLDETIRQAFNAHQTKAKGLGDGPALGPMAVHEAERAFKAKGYQVQTRTSTWHLLAGSAYTKAMGFRLINGWHQAACEMLPDQSDAFDVWFVHRQSELNHGQIGIEVGHTDLYAEPMGG
jgi:hypothetical protein